MKDVFKAIGVGGALGLLAIFLLGNGETPDAGQEVRGKPIKNEFIPKAPSAQSNLLKSVFVDEVKLTSKNSYVFRSEVNGLTAARAQAALIEMDKALPSGKPIYLVLDTPGGDIVAGNMLADTARGLHRPVHTVTIFAASMGFNIAQRLSTRYILPSGTLMAHRARVEGVGGQIPGEFLTQAARLLAMTEKMEMQNAARLGIGFAEYTALVNAEYWVEGESAVRQNAADKLASITCDASLGGTHNEYVNTMFGKVALVWSDCPAITNPLDFKFAGPEEQEKSIRKALTNYEAFRRTALQERGL